MCSENRKNAYCRDCEKYTVWKKGKTVPTAKLPQVRMWECQSCGATKFNMDKK